MSDIPPAVRALAERLLAIEAAASPSGFRPESVGAACENIQTSLTRFAGVNGYSSLISRALSLAVKEAPELAGVHLSADGRLRGLDSIPAGTDAWKSPGPGETALVSELIGLLITLVGEAMTLRLLRDAWPGTSIELQNSSTEETP